MAPMPEPMPTLTALRSVSGEKIQCPGQERTEAGADLGVGPSRPPEPAGADRQRRSDDLYHHRAQADAPGLWCTASMAAVGAVAFGLGREAEDQPAGK